MKNILAFLLSFLLSLILTYLVKQLSISLKIFDLPGFRKIHEKPVPLLGGLAVFVSSAIPFTIFAGSIKETAGITIIGFLFVLFGLIDDFGKKLNALVKILTHLIISFVYIYLTSYLFPYMFGVSFRLFNSEVVNWLLTAGFITFMANSINMLDGMDGLVAGVAFLASGFMGFLAWDSGQSNVLLFALIIMGTTLGFLKYNFNPASIFLGEAGATLLGFFLAIMAINLDLYKLWDVAMTLKIESLQLISFIVPLVILGIPIFDTYFVFANRFIYGIKISQPGRDHSHHRIALMGLSQKTTVLTLYFMQMILGAIAITMVRATTLQFFALLLIVIILFIGFTIFLARVKVYQANNLS